MAVACPVSPQLSALWLYLIYGMCIITPSIKSLLVRWWFDFVESTEQRTKNCPVFGMHYTLFAKNLNPRRSRSRGH